MKGLSQVQEERLHALLAELIDQQAASVLVPPHRGAPGFWFGGGDLAQDAEGTIWLSGRYRDYGDSRTGLEAGQRGLECVILRSDDGGQSYEKVRSWSKADLSRNAEVLSIEGTDLQIHADGTCELYISSEKALSYPESLRDYQKPGTGVWTIDCMRGTSIEHLDPATLTSVLVNGDRPEYLHVKDPVVFRAEDGSTNMVFCSHPYCWSSSNTGLAVRCPGGDAFTVQSWELVSRGATWDVAATRVTGRMAIPPLGCFASSSPCSAYFYDGAECLRDHEESSLARKRPRGYSCEELGGAMWGWDASFPELERLSRLAPMFVSPWGTGCSRYVSCLVTDTGIHAVWQQSQADGSQPLVGHTVPMSRAEQILSGG
ncbi:MAG: exo-alpha-sialidase [Chloroflexi bacterium]|nr:exo-alpha-sialidase [Chloroflexota bacterium]